MRIPVLGPVIVHSCGCQFKMFSCSTVSNQIHPLPAITSHVWKYNYWMHSFMQQHAYTDTGKGAVVRARSQFYLSLGEHGWKWSTLVLQQHECYSHTPKSCSLRYTWALSKKPLCDHSLSFPVNINCQDLKNNKINNTLSFSNESYREN